MSHSIRSRRSPDLGCGLCLVLGLLWSLAAHAGDVEEAKMHFDKAQTAYKLGQFEEALREYEAAYRAMPDAAFLFNMAQSHRQQYHADHKPFHLHKSLSLYRSYLREIPSAPNRETVQKLIEELQSLISAMEEQAQRGDTRAEKKEARLVIRGDNAQGGQVTLDGKSIGTVPIAQSVSPGVHQVRVTRAGFRPYETSVTISAGSRLDLPVTLESLQHGGVSEAPVYKKWWFWTIIGVAVAGGAGTGIYFATRGDNITSMPEIDLR